MLFTLACLILKLSLTTALLCTNCRDIVLSFNNPKEFPQKCQGTAIESIACQTKFRVNYLTKEIHMDLTSGNDPKRNNQLNLSVQKKFDEPKITDGNITYICKTSNECAKSFYQSTIETLIQNERILNQLQTELYDPTINDTQQCSNNNDQPITCENAYGCHGFEIIENGKADYEGECRNASTITIFPRYYFRITLVQGDGPTVDPDWNHLGFTCNTGNLCNNRQHIRKMVKLANDFYPWAFIGVNSSPKVLFLYPYLLLFTLILAI